MRRSREGMTFSSSGGIFALEDILPCRERPLLAGNFESIESNAAKASESLVQLTSRVKITNILAIQPQTVRHSNSIFTVTALRCELGKMKKDEKQKTKLVAM